MENEDVVRSVVPDDVFDHLRRQDEVLAAIQKDVAPVVEVIKKLDGFANFCSRWGKRINVALKWLAGVGPALVLLWQWLSEPVHQWFKAKNGG